MTNHDQFHSRLGPTIERYLCLKRALGREYQSVDNVYRDLDRWLLEIYPMQPDLTAESFLGWTHSLMHLSSGVRRNRMRVVRNLCLYRRRSHPGCFVPDKAQFPPKHQPIEPHIFTPAEILRLLDSTATLPPTLGSPLRSQTFRLATVLLYTTGLRRGELVRLTLGDYDPRDRTLLIRESKFHKSRLLPLSDDGVHELEAYLTARQSAGVALGPKLPLLWNRARGGNPYTGTGLGQGFRYLFAQAQIRTAKGNLPRVHDLRHAFAVNALLRWYRAGVDVQARLPCLATYMGHVSIVSTHYYLRFVEELAAAASERFARLCAGLVTVTGGDE